MDIDGLRRLYALVRLSSAAESFVVESIGGVPYQSVGFDYHSQLYGENC
jgi:hypothetical protein